MSKMAPFVLLVGNSGSGKDTLIREALTCWPSSNPELIVPRRFITRPPHPSEPYQSVTKEDFIRMKKKGMFCLSWISYGLLYGVPVEVLADQKKGHPILVNVSRNVIDDARKRIPGIFVVYVDVPYRVTLARIIKRRREPKGSSVLKERLLRAKSNPMKEEADFIIDNSASLKVSVRKLVSFISGPRKKGFIPN